MGYTYSFEKLDVWYDARAYSKMIYTLTRQFPSEERFGLSSQIQRAAVSIASNIAEGSGRTMPKDQLRFYEIAFGSLMETVAQLYLAFDIAYISKEQLDNAKLEVDKIAARLSLLRNGVQKKLSPEKN